MKKALTRLALLALALPICASLALPVFFGNDNSNYADQGNPRLGIVDLLAPTRADAQGFSIPPNSFFVGKQLIGNNTAPPVPTNGTLAAGSTDMFGKVTVTADTANTVVTFASAYSAAPICLLNSATAATTTRPKWTTSTTALTITAGSVANTDIVSYLCFGTQR